MSIRPAQFTARSDDPEPFKRNGSAPYTEQRMFSHDEDAYGLTFRWVMKMAGDANMSRPYAQHPWVHACVSAIAKAVSSVPLVLQREVGGGNMEPLTSGPLYDLFSRPNKLMSQRKFAKSVTQTQQLYGETMLIMMRRRPDGVVTYIEPSERIQVPDELWPVRGDLLQEVIDPRTSLPSAWRMQTQKGVVEIPAESVVHLAEANPYNPIRGMGPMQAAYRTAAKDFVLDRYDEALLQNSGSPGGILSVDGHLTDADQRAISDAWREAHGRPDSHRKTAVLPQGTKYEEIGFSPQEMEFQQMRDWNRETIMSIFGVTKPIIGLTEGLNYASSVSAFRSFWEVTVIPFLEFLSDELETKFIRRLQGPDSELSVEFDLSGVAALREDADSKVERTIKLFTQGARTFSEAADLAGWDVGDTQLGHADQAYVSSSLVPLVDGEAPAPPNPEADEALEEQEPGDEYLEGDDDDDEEFEEDELTEEERAVDPGKIDEVYRSWRALVNMSASELEAWSKNPCSRKASLNPTAVINRNLRLLRTKKADWDATHVRAANRAISFISRMRGMPKGEGSGGCPSKRDISLKNWAYNPDKAGRGLHLDRAMPPGLETEEAQLKYWEGWDRKVQVGEDRIARGAKRVLRGLVLQIRSRLRAAAEGPWQSSPQRSLTKAVITEAEVMRLLDINKSEWEAELYETLEPRITGLMEDSAAGAADELGGAVRVLRATDPVAVQYMASKELVLKGIVANVIEDVQRNIVKIMASGELPYTSLREAIWNTLADSEAYLNKELKGLGTRAALIARTESTGAANYGRQEQFRSMGVYTQIWLSQPSARPHHSDLSGKEVQIGDEFGYGLRYPGDPSAPVGEIANCRCVLLPGTQREE